MWIKIEKDVFSHPVSVKKLDFLIQLLTWASDKDVPRYHVFVELTTVGQLASYSALSQFNRELIEDEYDLFVNASQEVRYFITNNNNRHNRFNLDESIRFFLQPVSVILENSKNDASFINAIVDHFDVKNEAGLKILREFIDNGWLQYENAGGCGNVKNFIEGKLQSFNALAVKNNRAVYDYLRCTVILDSDKHYPTESFKDLYVELEEYLLKIGVRKYHILAKRSMENYMPDEVVINLTQTKNLNLRSKLNTRWVTLYSNLTAVQKDYLSYNGDFKKDEDGNVVMAKEVAQVYTLSKENIEILRKGLTYPKFKDEFPNLFNDPLVNKKSLSDRAGSDELEMILEKIKSLI